MNTFTRVALLCSGLLVGLCGYASAQELPVLTATLGSETPAAQSIPADAQSIDVAQITLTASVGDVYLNGIYLATDTAGGLSNFTNLRVYDVTHTSATSTPIGTYPNQSDRPTLLQFGSVAIIGNGMSKTYLIRADFSSSAAGNVRVGFGGFTFATQDTPVLSGIPIYGHTLTLPGVVITPTPSPTPTPTPSPSATTTPSGFTSLAALGLSEGNTISASGLPAGQAGSNDPDIYIVNAWGYKRLFLNPIIFSFYGHLGGFANVKHVTPQTRDVLITSGLFRNCETNDSKVYGIEATGEDTGALHWVNTSGTQALQDDPNFFKKVFCINSSEFSWYSKGSDYTSVNQISPYTR